MDENGGKVEVLAKSFAFRWSNGSYGALDFFEPRTPGVFATISEARAQVQAWNTQAAVNLLAGALSGVSFVETVSGVGARLASAETDSRMYQLGQRAGTGASLAALVTGVGVVNGLGKVAPEAIGLLKGIRITSGPLGSFAEAGKYGLGSANSLKQLVGKGSGLEVPHLIEKRFAKALGVKESDMLSIVLTPAEHTEFTQSWRSKLGMITN